MADAALPPSLARVLQRFAAMAREERMQALVHYARKLEPVPARFAHEDRATHAVPECNTPVWLFHELADGRLHFWAEVDVRQSPTVAAFLAITLGAVNDQPPAVTLAIPDDYVRRLMHDLGLATREAGLTAMVGRLKRHAREAAAGGPPSPTPPSP